MAGGPNSRNPLVKSPQQWFFYGVLAVVLVAWLERVVDMRRLRGVCGKVMRRLLSLRVTVAFAGIWVGGVDQWGGLE